MASALENNNVTVEERKPSSHEVEDFSFPGRRDQLRGANHWLECKRKADGIDKNLWRIHDNLYDLSAFASRHPGGRRWIEVTKGTDITEAFESSHFFSEFHGAALLAKYYVRSCGDQPRYSPFTFHEDGFYKTLKRRVTPILKRVGTGPTRKMKLILDGLALTYNLMVVAYLCTGRMPFAVAAGLVLGMTSSAAHNFFHQADNWHSYYFDLSVSSSSNWRITHALSHHMFPHTAADYEVYAFLPFVELSVVPNKGFVMKYLALAYYHLIFFFAPVLEAASTIGHLLRGTYRPNSEEVIPLAYLGLFCALSDHWMHGAGVYIIIQCLASYWVIFTSLTTTHHHNATYHAGDFPHPTSRDWGLHQLDTVRDVDKGDNLLFEASTFGNHLLHHLFPTVDQSKLHHLRQVTLKTCQEFGVNYPYMSPVDMFVGLHKQIMREEPSTFNEREAERCSKRLGA